MKPTGKDLLAKLIELYAKQEGVKVTYKIEERSKTDVLQQRSDS
jgi:hypothetical protein